MTSQPPHTSRPNTIAPANAFERRHHNLATPGLHSQSSDERSDVGYTPHSRVVGRDGTEGFMDERITTLSPPTVLPMHTLGPFHDRRNDSLLAHSIPVRNIAPTCPLDGLLLDYLAAQHQKALDGASDGELVGPPYPCVVAVLCPQRSLLSHPLSKVFTDMLVTFPDLDTLPEQIAVLSVFSLRPTYILFPLHAKSLTDTSCSPSCAG